MSCTAVCTRCWGTLDGRPDAWAMNRVLAARVRGASGASRRTVRALILICRMAMRMWVGAPDFRQSPAGEIAVTVVLARVVLGERLARPRQVGVLVALAGVAMIAAAA